MEEVEEKIRSFYKDTKWKKEILDSIVFNELLMKVYKLELNDIKKYISKFPHIYVNGHGMNELIDSGRLDIARFLYENNYCNGSAKLMFETI